MITVDLTINLDAKRYVSLTLPHELTMTEAINIRDIIIAVIATIPIPESEQKENDHD